MNSNEARLREMAMQIKGIQDMFPQADPHKQEEFAEQAMPLLEELEKILTEIVAIQQQDQELANTAQSNAQPSSPPR